MEFHFYNSCPNCCPENAVYAPNNYQGLRVFCANNVFDTVTAVDNNFFITFVSHLVNTHYLFSLFIFVMSNITVLAFTRN